MIVVFMISILASWVGYGLTGSASGLGIVTFIVGFFTLNFYKRKQSKTCKLKGAK